MPDPDKQELPPFQIPGMAGFSTMPTGNPPQVEALPPFTIPGMGSTGTEAALLRLLTHGMATPRLPQPRGPLGPMPGGQDPTQGLPELYQPKKIDLPTAPTAPKKSEWSEQKPFLMALAMLASSFTRQPAVAAMKAMAGMLQGEREGNQEAYQNSRAEYQDQLSKALNEQKQELEEYQTSYNNRALAWSERLAQMRATAVKRGHGAMLQTLDAGADPGSLLASYHKAGIALTPAKEKAVFMADLYKKEPGISDEEAEARFAQFKKQAKEGELKGTGKPGDPQLSGDDLLKTLDPGTAAEVKALAEYRLPVMNFRSEKMQKLVRLAAQYDPNFDAMQYPVRFGVKKDFTSGKSAQNITAMNTLIGHMRSLHEEASGLQNTKWPSLNRPLNEAARLTGDPRLIQFQTNMLAVGEELGRVFKGTVTEGEVKRWSEAINAAQSPAQLQGAIQKLSELLNSRVEALGDQYRRGTGQEMELLSPHSKESLEFIQKNKVKGAGGLASPKTQEEYEALPKGTQFIAPDGTTRVKP